MALLTTVDGRGHTTLEYDATKTDELDEARTTFEANQENGYLSFAGGDLITEFDPDAELITMTPVVAGG